MSQKSKITAQAFILRDGKILLVHDKGDIQPSQGTNNMTFKPPGYGMPGGGVDKTEGELLERIKSQLVLHKIAGDYEEAKKKMKPIPYNPEIEFLVFLTLISECLEETGFLVCPAKTLFEEIVGAGHRVPVVQCEILDGTICKRSLETDDCDWHNITKLPEGIYRSHAMRIDRGLRILGFKEPSLEEEMAGSL